MNVEVLLDMNIEEERFVGAIHRIPRAAYW